MGRRVLGITILCLALCGCAPEVQDLQRQIQALKITTEQQKKENISLNEKLDSCNSLAATLNNEKRSRHEDLTSLKAKTRLFIKNEYDTFNLFSKNKELMDYMGGELITRMVSSGSNQTIVNLNPFPSDSIIYMIKGAFNAGTVLVPQLFRNNGDKIVCIWQGPLVEIYDSGEKTYDFETPLTTRKGDFFGFYFPKRVTISYDTRTGKYAAFKGKVEIGHEIPTRNQGENRNYSIGVAGFLE